MRETKMSKSDASYGQLISDEEDVRLDVQNQVLRYFDADIYHRVISGYASPRILDVGCGTGDMIANMVTGIDAPTVFGIDNAKRQIDAACKRHPTHNFSVLDVESDTFLDDMRRWMASQDVCSFDVINCSMVLMHLADPTTARSSSVR